MSFVLHPGFSLAGRDVRAPHPGRMQAQGPFNRGTRDGRIQVAERHRRTELFIASLNPVSEARRDEEGDEWPREMKILALRLPRPGNGTLHPRGPSHSAHGTARGQLGPRFADTLAFHSSAPPGADSRGSDSPPSSAFPPLHSACTLIFFVFFCVCLEVHTGGEHHAWVIATSGGRASHRG